MAIQRSTWDSFEVPGVNTIFYVGHGLQTRMVHENILEVSSPDTYAEMHWKFQEALEWAHSADWDFIFRTNASSYINKVAVQGFAATLPRGRCYAGVSGQTMNADWLHVNGAGIFLSRDCAELLRRNLSFNHTPYVEDGEIGRIMSEHRIPITLGYRFEAADGFVNDTLHYHYKCKSPTTERGEYEINQMTALFSAHQKSL